MHHCTPLIHSLRKRWMSTELYQQRFMLVACVNGNAWRVVQAMVKPKRRANGHIRRNPTGGVSPLIASLAPLGDQQYAGDGCDQAPAPRRDGDEGKGGEDDNGDERPKNHRVQNADPLIGRPIHGRCPAMNRRGPNFLVGTSMVRSPVNRSHACHGPRRRVFVPS